MFNLVIYQPEIPPNTGNIIRLCANTGTKLHLIEPLGFKLEDKRLIRAGLDYHEFAQIQIYTDYEHFLSSQKPARLFALSTKGTSCYAQHSYLPGDYFMLGPESRGLPKEILEGLPPSHVIKLPQLPHSRSLNLSNTAAIILYEALRQNEFAF